MLKCLALSVCLVAPSCGLFAWSHSAFLRTEWLKGTLAYSVHHNHSIYFCIATEDPAHFPENEMALQVREAIHLWVKAARLAYPVKIQKVTCDNSTENLKVRVGKAIEHPELSAYYLPQLDGNRFYALIQINTKFRHTYRKNKKLRHVRVANTYQFKPKESNATDWLRSLVEKDDVELDSLTRHWKVDYETVFYSTYKMLLHEVGHAFGLCDGPETPGRECDPVAHSEKSASGVMNGADTISLTADDRVGIRKLFSRFTKN